MSPRRRLLPILLFLLTVLFIYSYHSSFNLFFPNSQSTQFNIHSSPTPPNFTLTLKVLTFDRLNSLSRCLNSLANADYGEDRVNLHVFIDHFKEMDGDGKIEEVRKRLDFVDGFVWRFGEKFVHYRTGNVGLQAQWLEAWWPSSDDEFAFVVEDDLEVSPLFYKFLKGLIVNYYYNESNYNPNIYGASLQRPRFVPGNTCVHFRYLFRLSDQKIANSKKFSQLILSDLSKIAPNVTQCTYAVSAKLVNR